MFSLLLVFLLLILLHVGIALGTLAALLAICVSIAPDPPALRRENRRRCIQLAAIALVMIVPAPMVLGWWHYSGHFPNGYRLINADGETYIADRSRKVVVEVDLDENSIAVSAPFVTGQTSDGAYFALNTYNGQAVVSFDVREIDAFLGVPIRNPHAL